MKAWFSEAGFIRATSLLDFCARFTLLYLLTLVRGDQFHFGSGNDEVVYRSQQPTCLSAFTVPWTFLPKCSG